MRTIFICIFVIALPSVVEADNARLLKMHEFLSRSDLVAFMDNVRSNGWVAPKIYSQWHVDRLITDLERKHEEKLRRSLGGLIVERLGETAQEIRKESNLRNIELHCQTLISLSIWLTKSNGYGNSLLAMKCHDVGATAVARLVADLDYPLVRVKKFVEAFDSPFYGVEARMKILNEEAGAAVFRMHVKDPIDLQKELEMTWAAGSILLLGKKNPSAIKLRRSRVLSSYPGDLDTLERHLDFFGDDPIAALNPPYTLRSRWDKKWHEKFIIGLEVSSVRKMRALFVFREKVGAFPTTVPYKKHPFSSDGEAAFDRAWRPFARQNPKLHTLYSTAWRAYDEIKKNVFVDSDTQSIMNFVK